MNEGDVWIARVSLWAQEGQSRFDVFIRRLEDTYITCANLSIALPHKRIVQCNPHRWTRKSMKSPHLQLLSKFSDPSCIPRVDPCRIVLAISQPRLTSPRLQIRLGGVGKTIQGRYHSWHWICCQKRGRFLDAIDTMSNRLRGLSSACVSLQSRTGKARASPWICILCAGGFEIGRAPGMLKLLFDGATMMIPIFERPIRMRRISLITSTLTGCTGLKSNSRNPPRVLDRK